MSSIRWGIIGCGEVTEVKSGPAFSRAQGSALVAVMRRDGEKAADYARRHGVPRWYDDARRLIADAEVDAVYVATPPSTHAQYTILAAAAGKPVYVEKPMALDAVEGQTMIDACAAAGVPLFVAYYRRALPRFLRVQALLAEGAIGPVRAVTVIHHQPAGAEAVAPLPWRVVPALSGGGLFADVGCHTLDLLDHLLGPILEVDGAAVNQACLYPAEDTVTARFRFASGACATGSWCFVSGVRDERVILDGATGRIEMSIFAEAPLRITVDGATRLEEIPHPPHVQQPLVQTVVDQLLGRGACSSTGQTALRTTRVMDAVLDAHRRRTAAALAGS